ncbi:hypothetical protein K493DRAFT_304529 [Basidiobolus meristosporus CBS 931.73]|uniref:Uncharacterized protein n=1 Tax=Basidiobolus meristosporus CBS 931.73 TaxID=1314790 RepID=A0A1Y1XYM3_9FUNG|nr:hypothetical protein K493DRAFT_304529 [Basidiobolus meristosporus CBS 931.73]|eukprot:ORX90850.1 hypothetical protein K493DRAFT_304529 [Basidiobolus meristosporus CBS 931.73]
MPSIQEQIVLCQFLPEELQEYKQLQSSLPEEVGWMGANTYLRLYSCHPYMYTWSRKRNRLKKAADASIVQDVKMSEDDFLPEIDEDLEAVAVEVEEQLQEINSKEVDSSSNCSILLLHQLPYAPKTPLQLPKEGLR